MPSQPNTTNPPNKETSLMEMDSSAEGDRGTHTNAAQPSTSAVSGKMKRQWTASYNEQCEEPSEKKCRNCEMSKLRVQKVKEEIERLKIEIEEKQRKIAEKDASIRLAHALIILFCRKKMIKGVNRSKY